MRDNQDFPLKLIAEIIKYLFKKNLINEDLIRRLEELWILQSKKDKDTRAKSSSPNVNKEEDFDSQYEKEILRDDFEDELDRKFYGDFYHPGKRYGKSLRRKRKSRPVVPELTVEELNQCVKEDWKKITEEFPRLEALWDSWKAGKLIRVLADGFTLNDIYALIKVEQRDYREFSGPAAAAYRQLLRQVGNAVGKYSWVIKSSETVSMVEFPRFRQQIFEEVRELYETDRDRFDALSSQNGKLNLPTWDNAVQTDSISMRVWTILNLSSTPVTPEMIELIQTSKPELAIAIQINWDYTTELLTKFEKRDWSFLTIVTARNIENTIIKTVEIPAGVTKIGKKAFRGCCSLTSVTIPVGVTTIGCEAFSGCSSLASAAIPVAVTTIGERAFNDCKSLTSVVIPDGVTAIENETFRGCDSLSSVVIPDGVTEIGERAFIGCKSLTSVTIPEGVKAIRHGAFSGCCSLTSVTIPADVKEFGKGTFYSCAAPGKALLSEDGRYLLSVNVGISGKFVIPESVRVIVPNAFFACKSLTSVVIPEGIKEIGSCAFCDCADSGKAILSEDGRILLNVNKDISSNYVIPNSVRVIAPNAFCKCSSLTSVIIPESVMKIGSEAFLDCPKLTIISSAPSYAEEYAFVYDIRFQPIKHRN